MNYPLDDEVDWRHDENVLSLKNYNRILEQYNILVQENEKEGNCFQNEHTDYLPIPCETETYEKSDNIIKFPYLKRGAGLARYNMTIESLKQAPPKITNSFSKPAINRNKAQKPHRVATKTLKPAQNLPLAKIPIQHKVPERKYATKVVKSFDDEVIPTLRHQTALSGEAFEVPIPESLLYNRHTPPKHPDLSKTPMKKLVLKRDCADSHKYESEEETEQEILSSERKVSPTVRRLSYDELEVESIMQDEARMVAQVVKRKSLTDHLKALQKPRDSFLDEADLQHLKQVKREIAKSSGKGQVESNPQSKVTCAQTDKFQMALRSDRQIADAMKRKGLTDNVRKHLGWAASPRRKRPICIVKKLKIKKPKPCKAEKVNLCELKDRLRQLEEVKNQLQLENYKIKRIERDYLDEKLKLDKQRKELEIMIKQEKDKLAEEWEKLDEDQKKFKRDKIAFEKYSQEVRNFPSREEREEIRTLKVELATLKENQKTKEARVGACQAQLRSRIVILEKENATLKEELEIARKVSVKKVRFESEGRVKSKLIDVINTQLGQKLRPNSAREQPLVRPQPLRRSKSATDIKQAPVKVRVRGKSSGAVVNETNTPAEEEPCEEVIDMVGCKSADSDSGVGSRSSSCEDSSSRSDSHQVTNNPAPQPYAAIFEIKRRVENLIGDSTEPIATKAQDYGSKRQSSLEDRACNSIPSCEGSSTSPWPNCCPTVLDVTEECCLRTNDFTLRKNSGRGVCSRHGLPITEQRVPRDTRPPDRDVVRTQLAGGDFEDEELRTGVRRVWCGTCGACEVTYRTRPGYRRTTTPEGNVMEELPNGIREWTYTTGEVVRKFPNGDKILLLPNGEREYTTQTYKKLERPDGIVKTVFVDGRQETKYPSGRIRVKDRYGHLVMDTGGL